MNQRLENETQTARVPLGAEIRTARPEKSKRLIVRCVRVALRESAPKLSAVDEVQSQHELELAMRGAT